MVDPNEIILVRGNIIRNFWLPDMTKFKLLEIQLLVLALKWVSFLSGSCVVLLLFGNCLAYPTRTPQETHKNPQ